MTRFLIILPLLLSLACVGKPQTAPDLRLTNMRTLVTALDLFRDAAISLNDNKRLSEKTTREIVLFHRDALTVLYDTKVGWQEAIKTMLDAITEHFTQGDRAVLSTYEMMIRSTIISIGAELDGVK